MNLLVAIVGPTATGKSQQAVHLAQQFNGEIVSADSRQVYCHMDIGTAKPGREEQSLVPHHLIDIVNPDEDFSLAQYQQLAYRAIADIQRRNKLPLLVGGSGLYVWAVLEGWEIPRVIPDPEFRRSLEKRATNEGTDALYQELVAVDPVAAESIDRRNVRRLIRAIEVSRSAGAHFSRLQRKQAPPFNTLIIGLTADRTELYHRIDLRVDKMLEQGLVEEVKRLMNMGYDLSLPAMSGIGYKQIGLFLRGELSLAEATQQIKYETHRFVRHQYSWFRLKDDRIRWFDIKDEVESEIRDMVTGFV
ncbi:MAG: tRNA (adenosine(37)-N6)-dimethylallyltransferase MiaA [Chloroflexi bacterium]|nr:tRNA (adenosine(37)-N6)-dimethylallyltransferase MiaA [Chloroflexota bacterium]